MKPILIIALIITSMSLIAKETFKFSVTKENQGYACSKARGESRRQLNAICEKIKKKVDWDHIDISECKGEKMGPAKFKATYTYKYECIKE